MRNLLWEEASTLTSLQFIRVLFGRRMNVNWFHHRTLLVRCGFSVLVGWLMGQFYSANSFWAHLKSRLRESRFLCVILSSSNTFGLKVGSAANQKPSESDELGDSKINFSYKEHLEGCCETLARFFLSYSFRLFTLWTRLLTGSP